jgi:hypothetical protein
LILGVIAGLITAFPVAQMKHPLVCGLAGRLADLSRLAVAQSTEGTGTIIIPG